MFFHKKKQEKNSNKKQISNIDDYHQKIKRKSFEIYLNSGINDYDKVDQNYTNVVTINYLSQLSQNLIKGFSSIYQIDHKSFQFNNKVQGLINTGKQVLKVVDRLKKEIGKESQIQERLERISQQNIRLKKQLEDLRHQYEQVTSIQHKISIVHQHEVIQERLKRQMKDRQVIIEQKDSQIKMLLQQNDSLLQQNLTMKNKTNELQIKCKEQMEFLRKIRESCFDEKIINDTRYLQCEQGFKQCGVKADIAENSSQQKHKSQKQMINSDDSSFETLVLFDSKLSSKIISYLPPRSICALFSLSRTSRFFLTKSYPVILSAFESINGYKNYQISFFHRHINTFQQILKKIPEEVIQSAFYQYMILKEQVGGDFQSILNICGNLFQGKFTLDQHQQFKTIKEYVQSLEIIHFVEKPKNQEYFLKIDEQIVSQFFQQRKGKKQSIMKEIEIMNQKITTTQSFYFVDEQTLQKFHNTILKNFTIIFILGKHLYQQARNLQYLNNFLLGHLSQINKFKIQKQYDLEDIKTELESSLKMIQFLSEKSNKSEQKILRQVKQELELKKKVKHLQELIKLDQSRIQILQKQRQERKKQIQTLNDKNQQIKVLYNSNKDKYNRLINELGIVKQTILKIT